MLVSLSLPRTNSTSQVFHRDQQRARLSRDINHVPIFDFDHRDSALGNKTKKCE
jgi:hypothetical protein